MYIQVYVYIYRVGKMEVYLNIVFQASRINLTQMRCKNLLIINFSWQISFSRSILTIMSLNKIWFFFKTFFVCVCVDFTIPDKNKNKPVYNGRMVSIKRWTGAKEKFSVCEFWLEAGGKGLKEHKAQDQASLVLLMGLK